MFNFLYSQNKNSETRSTDSNTLDRIAGMTTANSTPSRGKEQVTVTNSLLSGTTTIQKSTVIDLIPGAEPLKIDHKDKVVVTTLNNGDQRIETKTNNNLLPGVSTETTGTSSIRVTSSGTGTQYKVEQAQGPFGEQKQGTAFYQSLLGQYTQEKNNPFTGDRESVNTTSSQSASLDQLNKVIADHKSTFRK